MKPIAVKRVGGKKMAKIKSKQFKLKEGFGITPYKDVVIAIEKYVEITGRAEDERLKADKIGVVQRTQMLYQAGYPIHILVKIYDCPHRSTIYWRIEQEIRF